MPLIEDTPAQVQALADRVMACDPDVRDWVERQAYEALDARIASGNAIAARVNGLLTVLLGAMAAAGTLAVKVFEPGAPVAAWGAVAAAGYLWLLVLYMVRAVISLGDAPAQRARPGLLAQPGVTIQQIKSGELARVDERIRQQATLNSVKAAALNRVYSAAAATPLAFAIGCVAAWSVSR